MGRGGSEAVVMWGAEALKNEFAVSIVTSNAIDLAALNSYYGTAVDDDEVTVRRVPMPSMLFKIRSGAAIRGSFFQKGIRRIAGEYDVLFSAYNLCDCGIPAIHLLDLSWDEELRTRYAPAPGGFEGVFHRVAGVRAVYLWLVRRISSPSERDLLSGEDVLLANSRWVASVIERKHGFKCGLLYPPVPGACVETPFAVRNSDFVCLGRISEEKRVERIVAILAKVRARGHEVRLRIVGDFGAGTYARKIQALVRDLPWVVAEGSVSDRRKIELLSSCRYGIHGAEGEAFGIAVAEMVRAGCITFACATGGPAEILDHPALLYRDEDDAVEKICAVMGSERMSFELSAHLRRQAGKFSAENFMVALREIVAEFLGAPTSSVQTSV
jgi:glycosyltransferase involved in cell wall biosynthesis